MADIIPAAPAEAPEPVVSRIRVNLITKLSYCGLSEDRAFTEAKRWQAWIAEASGAEREAREQLAMVAIQAYATAHFDAARAEDLADMARWCVVTCA